MPAAPLPMTECAAPFSTNSLPMPLTQLRSATSGGPPLPLLHHPHWPCPLCVTQTVIIPEKIGARRLKASFFSLVSPFLGHRSFRIFSKANSAEFGGNRMPSSSPFLCSLYSRPPSLRLKIDEHTYPENLADSTEDPRGSVRPCPPTLPFHWRKSIPPPHLRATIRARASRPFHKENEVTPL